MPYDDESDKKFEKFDGNTPDDTRDSSGESSDEQKRNIKNHERLTLAREKELLEYTLDKRNATNRTDENEKITARMVSWENERSNQLR